MPASPVSRLPARMAASQTRTEDPLQSPIRIICVCAFPVPWRHLISTKVQHFMSSFRGCPRRLRAEPGIRLCNPSEQNWSPGSIADKAGDGPGMTSFFKVANAASR